MATEPRILLAALNAKYIHAAFGLRYLLANMGDLRERTALAEFDINQRPLDIAESILARNPAIVGIGIYIWNVTLATQLAALLKKIRPGLIVVLGGPEVSYETEAQEIVRLADYVVTGEGDLEFAALCRELLAGACPPRKIRPAALPELAQLRLPYEHYTEQDIAHRVVYVEASRGCPFSCEFCLSSLDIPVRQAPLDDFLVEMGRLLDRGVRQLKFVDRTFNLNLQSSRRILEFLLARYQPGHFFHFEMVPDRLPEGLRELITRFPPGSLQFEIGIQTFNEEVAARISRRQNYAALEDNFRFLREHTGAHLHADLIIGLPGETLASFAAGFDRLVRMGPQEIQVGILKRLRGTPISRHDAEWGMCYNPLPPYDILQSRVIDFVTMQRLRRFAKYWDSIANSGNFLDTTPLLWSGPETSPFHSFLAFSDALYAQERRTDSLALTTLVERLFEHLTGKGLEPRQVAASLNRDYTRAGRRDLPAFLSEHLPADTTPRLARSTTSRLPKRQARHMPES